MPLTESTQHMRNAIALLTLHVNHVGAEAEAKFGQAITADDRYAMGGITASLVLICERLLTDRQDMTGEDPHEFLQALALKYTDGS